MVSLPPRPYVSGFAKLHLLRRQSDSLQSRAANLVDSHCCNAWRAAAFECGLARWVLPKPGLHHITQNGFVNLFGVYARAGEGLLDGIPAQGYRSEHGRAPIKFFKCE